MHIARHNTYVLIAIALVLVGHLYCYSFLWYISGAVAPQVCRESYNDCHNSSTEFMP